MKKNRCVLLQVFPQSLHGLVKILYLVTTCLGGRTIAVEHAVKQHFPLLYQIALRLDVVLLHQPGDVLQVSSLELFHQVVPARELRDVWPLIKIRE